MRPRSTTLIPSSGSTTSRSASSTSSCSSVSAAGAAVLASAALDSALVAGTFSAAQLQSAEPQSPCSPSLPYLHGLRGRVLPCHPAEQGALDPGRILRDADERHRVLEHALLRLP